MMQMPQETAMPVVGAPTEQEAPRVSQVKSTESEYPDYELREDGGDVGDI